jgi:hypothetical protein
VEELRPSFSLRKIALVEPFVASVLSKRCNDSVTSRDGPAWKGVRNISVDIDFTKISFDKLTRPSYLSRVPNSSTTAGGESIPARHLLRAIPE